MEAERAKETINGCHLMVMSEGEAEYGSQEVL